MKTIITAVATAVLIIISSPFAMAVEGTCEQCREALAIREQELRQWENYYNMTHTGGSPMMDPNIRAFSDEVQRLRNTCASVCSSGAGQGGSGQPGYGNNGGYGNDGNSGGYGASRGAPVGPDPDNPFEDIIVGGGRGDDLDNPFEDDGPARRASKNRQVGGEKRAGARSGGASGEGGGPSEDDMKAALFGKKKGGNAAGEDDKPLTFKSRSCGYFTKPPEKDRLNSYAIGSKVCYGDWMYECTEDRGWVSVGKCSDYDKFFVKHAEDIEKSRFDTNIYLDD